MVVLRNEKSINKPSEYNEAENETEKETEVSKSKNTDHHDQSKNYYGKNISGQDFSSALLQHSNFSHSQSDNCNFTNTRLEGADFSFSDLKHSQFEGSNLKNTVFHFAQLEDCDLSTAVNLSETQFAGANLSYCKLPTSFSFPTLNYVQEAAKSLSVHLITLFLACLYSWIAIGSTTDIDLLHDAKSIFFPLLEMSLPTVGFYYISPLVLLVITLAFNFQLSLYWQRLSCLPSYFPDGSVITLKTFPTLIDNMVEQYFPLVKKNHNTFDKKVKLYLTLMVLFFVSPATLIGYWLRYIPRHDYVGSILHSSTIIICICSSFIIWHKIKRTAEPDHKSEFPNKRFIAATTILISIMFILSYGTSTGSKYPFSHMYMDISFQKLTQSTEPQTTRRTRRTEQSTTKISEYGFILDNRNLRHANMFHVNLHYGSLKNTILSYADLRKANLSYSEMKQADLTYARLDNATISNVNAIRANFSHAQLHMADLSDSVFSQGNFTSTNLTRAKMLRSDFSRSNLSHSTMDFIDASNANFSMAVMFDVSLNKSNLQNANFYLAQLNNSYFWRTDLTSATLILANCAYSDFTGANLSKANLSQSILNNAIFTNAVMDETSLIFAKLSMTNLVNASLKHADLSSAQLQNANLTGANLTGANFAGAWLENTILINADLRGAINLTAEQLKQAVIDKTTLLPPQFSHLLHKQAMTTSDTPKGVI